MQNIWIHTFHIWNKDTGWFCCVCVCGLHASLRSGLNGYIVYLSWLNAVFRATEQQEQQTEGCCAPAPQGRATLNMQTWSRTLWAGS